MYDFIKFLQTSYSTYHIFQNCVDMLDKGGFTELTFDIPNWNVEFKKNNKFYITINDTAIIAFTNPFIDRFNLFVTHNDSPTIKIKPNPVFRFEGEKDLKRLNVELYGGVNLNSWVGKSLGVAGKVIYNTPNGIQKILIEHEEFFATIPAKDKKGTDDKPIFYLLVTISNINSFLHEFLPEDSEILFHDLNLFPLVNISKETNGVVLNAPRLDNLISTYYSIKNLIQNSNNGKFNIVAAFDNEEVSSMTKQGSSSPFLYNVISKIYSHDKNVILKAISNSFMYSIDAAHGINPNVPLDSDITNKTIVNKGLVLKWDSNIRYVTDIETMSETINLLNGNGIRHQLFTKPMENNAGGTLARYISQTMCIRGIDMGVSVMGMHSAIETCGVSDLEELNNFLDRIM